MEKTLILGEIGCKRRDTFTELYREEKMGEGDRGGLEDKRGESKGERQIQPVITSLSVSNVWNTQRFMELDREEKREGGERSNLVEKKESSKEERAVKPVILLSSKNGY